MSRLSAKCRVLDLPQEVQGLLTTIASHAVAHHRTTQYVHAREQTGSFRDWRKRALALGDFQRSRMGCVRSEALELAPFGHTQKQGVLWRIKIQAGDVMRLLKELGTRTSRVSLARKSVRPA